MTGAGGGAAGSGQGGADFAGVVGEVALSVFSGLPDDAPSAAAGAAPSYKPCPASAPSSRNGEPGSSSKLMRSRGISVNSF